MDVELEGGCSILHKGGHGSPLWNLNRNLNKVSELSGLPWQMTQQG